MYYYVLSLFPDRRPPKPITPVIFLVLGTIAWEMQMKMQCYILGEFFQHNSKACTEDDMTYRAWVQCSDTVRSSRICAISWRRVVGISAASNLTANCKFGKRKEYCNVGRLRFYYPSEELDYIPQDTIIFNLVSLLRSPLLSQFRA